MGMIEDAIRASQAPQPTQMVIAAPQNDQQLVAWIAGMICAGNRGITPASGVEAAIDCIAESVVQTEHGAFAKAIDRARQRWALQNGPVHTNKEN